MVVFLLLGKLPPTCEGIRIYTAEKLLDIANVLHIAALLQLPVMQYFSSYMSTLISKHIVSSQKIVCQKRSQDRHTNGARIFFS